MRILELGLKRFGPFTDVELDLSRSGPTLHVVYGSNEAGKSTSLRAIAGLLFGIPTTTRDAHLHPMKDLRITGRLEAADGAELAVERRKGSKNTLLDPRGALVDEALLRRVLGGITEEAFAAMFGLDQEALRRGAQALLAGKGHIGESLFDAGLGGRGIQRVLDRLRAEADELYTPRAKKRKLNTAKRACDEARKRVGQNSLSAEGWIKQKEACEAAKADHAAATERRRALEAEQRRLQRAVLVLPKLGARTVALRDRASLGDFEPMSEDAISDRSEAQRLADEASREVERLEGEIQRLEADRDRLDVPVALLDISSEVIEDVRDRLGNHRKAAKDLPRRQGQLRALEEEAAAMLRGLGAGVPLDRVEELRVSAGDQARIKSLATRRSGIISDLDNIRSQRDRSSSKLEARRRVLVAIADAPETSRLREAVVNAKGLGGVNDRIDGAEARLRALELRVAPALASLRPYVGSLTDLGELTTPTKETIARFTRDWESALRADDELEKRRANAEARLREVRREIDRLRHEGDVPTEQQLEAARARRSDLWAEMKRGDRRSPEADENFERAIQETDVLADRLRREASRVAARARLLSEKTDLEIEAEGVDATASRLDQKRRSLEAAWAAVLGPLGMEELPPRELGEWLTRVETARELASERAAIGAELETLRARRTQLRLELAAALELAEQVVGEAESAETLIARAEGLIETAAESAAERRDGERDVAELERELDELDGRLHESEKALTVWKDAWSSSVRRLRLESDASPEEADAVLVELGEIFRKVTEIAQLAGRIEGMSRDAVAFTTDVRELAAQHLPDVAGLAVDEAAHQLVGRYTRAAADAAKRSHIDSQIEEKRAARDDFQRARSNALGRTEKIMSKLGVDSSKALAEIEARSRRARELDEQVALLERELVSLGDGASIEELLVQTRGVEMDSARSRISELDDEVREAEEERDSLTREVVSLTSGFDRLKQGAADAAADLQTEVAWVQTHARRYLRVHLATMLLEREVERYRELNQGPILKRASSLLCQLTLAGYTGLREGIGAKDEPVLRCVRAEGSEVSVEGLSEGTRDQLYLALRLASLERYAETNGPPPFILDDVFITFDEQRTKAALSVLADVCERVQVLYFTHHARVVELARETVGSERLVVHDLDEARARMAPAQPMLLS